MTLDLSLELTARSRFDVVDLRAAFLHEYGDALSRYPRCLYWSAHTTAGFLDRGLSARLGPRRVPSYVAALRRVFPEGAGYAHDALEDRKNLDPAQRAIEPRNGDSHLAFIAGGLLPCVTHWNDTAEAVSFVELDGVSDGRTRRRLTRAIGFHREVVAGEVRLRVPLSGHPIDSLNLKDTRLGLYDELTDFVAAAGVKKGRLHIALGYGERDAALTINEYETLLMNHDMAAVMRNPLWFMAKQTQSALANPRAIPGKALGYARYDLGRILNSSLDALGLHGSLVEKLVARTLAFPASRLFRVRRSINLLVAETANGGAVGPVEGIYQSPILLQWRRASRDVRELRVTLYALE
jgi:thiamine phosphate synthase YjbQ (UPF0047 family)